MAGAIPSGSRTPAVEGRPHAGMRHLAPLAIYLVALLAVSLFQFQEPISGDEGFTLHGAWKLYTGHALYGATFHSFLPPGSFVFLSAVFELFGPHYLAAKTAMLAGFAVGLWSLMRLAGALRLGLMAGCLATLAFVGTHGLVRDFVNHNLLSSLLALASVCALSEGLRRDRAGLTALAGVLAFGVLATVQTKGLALIGLLTLYLVWHRWTGYLVRGEAIAFIAGWALPTVGLLAHYGPQTLWWHLVVWPHTHYSAINTLPPGTLVGGIIALGVCWAVARRWSRAATLSVDLVGLLGLAGFASTVNHPNTYHLFVNAGGLILLGAVVLQAGLDQGPPALRKAVALGGMLTCVAGATTLALGVAAASAVRDPGQDFSARLRGCMTGPVESLYAHPFSAGVYFRLGVADPYPHPTLKEGMNEAGDFEAQLAIVQREQPEWVVLSYARIQDDFHQSRRSPIDDYVEAHYQPVPCPALDGEIEIWRKAD